MFSDISPRFIQVQLEELSSVASITVLPCALLVIHLVFGRRRRVVWMRLIRWTWLLLGEQNYQCSWEGWELVLNRLLKPFRMGLGVSAS